MEEVDFLFKNPEPLIFFLFDNELVVDILQKYVFYKTPCMSAKLPWLMNVLLIPPRLTFLE